MVTGGVDSALCPWGWTAHLAGGRLSTGDDPARAYLPFSADADGEVVGEGGALLVLERAAAARSAAPASTVSSPGTRPPSTRRPGGAAPRSSPGRPNSPWSTPG